MRRKQWWCGHIKRMHEEGAGEEREGTLVSWMKELKNEYD